MLGSDLEDLQGKRRFVDLLLTLPRPAKRAIALALDAMLCGITVYLAFFLRLGVLVNPFVGPPHPTMGAIAIALPIFVTMGLYRAIFRHAGFDALATVGRAVALYAIPYIAIYTVIGVYGVPRTIGLIQPILLFLFVAASRLLARAYLGETYRALWTSEELPRVVIYGAGRAGRQLASAIRASGEMRLVGFIDDDPDLWRSTINGTTVFSPAELGGLVKRKKVTDVLLALPSASRQRRGEIVAQLKPLQLHVRTLPGVMDLARGSISVGDLRDLEIEDLLGRSAVPPDPALIRRNVTGKTVLVSGAGGSIGSELCRQIAAVHPARLILVENAEFNLFSIHRELTGRMPEYDIDPASVIPILGSVMDERRMDEVIAEFAPDTVFHAAAYKHVPLVEHNATQGIANNVFGTLTLARAAQRHGVADFTLISTDKAVRPTNIMGTTKRLAEMVLQALAHEGGKTRFSMVRFGNVLGSSGSVVPVFRDQIAKGGPVTITDAKITRYFMTIPEAAQLVLQAGAMAGGGEVFLLDMGDPVRIVDLARNMIELSGLTMRDEDNPDGDIAIETIGLRPGEKMYEELLIGEEPLETEHSRIMRSREDFVPWQELERGLERLRRSLEDGDAAKARDLIIALVPEFQPQSPLVDWVACEKAIRKARAAGPLPSEASKAKSVANVTPIAAAKRPATKS
ncbi:polysaccharide biosynthesis protein [Pseudoblastomonas halimionae]|uniref:NAD-dependent epimerase/dehydratase family protein n=1 Tax=Alteriqipengyuania halimionae TaxID=1926630 RepID=A0A6I4U7N9_9SPHN|nr:nucleoside-diphosphate sugar epimerase/dehydratase [Alteriqipengyuania halimionae]MXP10923.1 NAD-dependent epimerase/dehydratase family protein [Alteriqipengyuania halimionae]